MKNYFKSILPCLVLVSLMGCSGKSRELTEEEIQISEELRSRFETSDQLIYNSDTLLASKEVLDYYNNNDFAPIWIGKTSLTNEGNKMLELIENSKDHGLLPEMYHYELIDQMKDTSLLDAEMMLTNAFFLMTTHVDVGCVDPVTYQYVWKKDSLDYDLAAELDKVKDGSPVDEVIFSHEPVFWDYHQLQAGLEKFLDEYPLDTNHYKIPAFKEDSVKCYHAAHEALIGHAFMDGSIGLQDSVFIEELKKFQKTNGLKDDAIVGKWTGYSLEHSNLDRFYHAALSLEKWRWKKKYPEKYIRVNIPEYTLYFVDSNQVKRKHRVVVGAYATQTPEFHAKMERMVTMPFWHVPYSIASTEILAGARKDTNYFDKRGYKVFAGGQQIDPTSVDWSSVKQSSFTYRVRQDGGGGNSLGKIKFLFPNEHSVFLHDTPSKGLFQNDVRAYSHGCVRLHEPFDLAKSILLSENNRIVPDTLDSLIARKTQRVIELDRPFEVFIEYITVTGDSSGNAIFYPDIYGRDVKYIENTYKQFGIPKFKATSSQEGTEVASNS
ncbi:MAG: L,D-transpeptidase family protein [Crocinitomicaceae bacterium]